MTDREDAMRIMTYRKAAERYVREQQAWEQVIRDDAFRASAGIVRKMFPDRPELKDLLDEIADRLWEDES